MLLCLRYLFTISSCFAIAFSQPQFKGGRENLGKEVNDAFDQVRPVFSADGSTLYFSQGSGKNLQYEIWRTTTDSVGRITGKQLVKALTPNTASPKYVLQSQSAHQLLVNGFYDVENNTLQYSRGISAIDISKAGETFNPAAFQKQHNRVLDSLFRKRNIFPVYHSFSHAWYWTDDAGGNTDIYLLPVGKNAGDTPLKLPASINTQYNELTPWLDDEGRYLYFASDRPGGYGETDIWVTERLDNSFANWSTPVNLGPVVNTSKSETYFIIDPGEVYAYVVSDKSGFGKNDIFRIALRPNKDAAFLSPLLIPSDKPDTSLLFQPQLHRISNIVFLLDISHSMAESRKMVLLKKAMYRLAQQLRATDRISIVTFGSGVEVLLNPQWLKTKADIFDAIQLLSANGGATNIGAGLKRAYEQADMSFLKEGNNQLLLVTDGVFTLKPADEQLVLEHSPVLFTTVIVGNDEAVSTAVAPLVQKARGQLLRMTDEAVDLNLLLQNVRANSRIKN